MLTKQRIRDTYPRLGELLVQRGLVSPDVIEHALALQRAAMEDAAPTPKLGEILVRRGVLDRRTIREIVEEQQLARGDKSKLAVRLAQVSGVAIVRIEGRLDRRTDSLLVRILARLRDRGVIRIAMDFQQLIHVDSYGISALLSHIDDSRSLGGDIKFFGLRPSAKLLFDRLELTSHLHVLDSQAEVIRAFRNPELLPSPAPLSEVVSSLTSRNYHLSFCPEANKIREETRLYFLEPDRAIRAGKTACPRCIVR